MMRRFASFMLAFALCGFATAQDTETPIEELEVQLPQTSVEDL